MKKACYLNIPKFYPVHLSDLFRDFFYSWAKRWSTSYLLNISLEYYIYIWQPGDKPSHTNSKMQLSQNCEYWNYIKNRNPLKCIPSRNSFTCTCVNLIFKVIFDTIENMMSKKKAFRGISHSNVKSSIILELVRSIAVLTYLVVHHCLQQI